MISYKKIPNLSQQPTPMTSTPKKYIKLSKSMIMSQILPKKAITIRYSTKFLTIPMK